MPSSVPKLLLGKGGLLGEVECCTPLPCWLLLRASAPPKVHCFYFGDQTRKIPVPKKPKLTWQLGTLEPTTWLAAVLQDGLCQHMLPFSPRRTNMLLPACSGRPSLPIPFLLLCHPAEPMSSRDTCPHRIHNNTQRCRWRKGLQGVSPSSWSVTVLPSLCICVERTRKRGKKQWRLTLSCLISGSTHRCA